jgi:hypothetical protein
VDTFWPRVDKGEGCWLWTGGVEGGGYGSIKKKGHHLAHRFSWELHYGEIPDGLYVCHKCDNPPCVRPDHLFLGTHQDNMRDMAEKGRRRSGRGNTKLTKQQVAAIRSRYSPGAVTYEQLGAEYGVSSGAINHIIHNRTHKEAVA